MINLLPPDKQKQIKSGRNRLFAVKFLLVSIIILAVVGGIGGYIYMTSGF